MPDAASEHTTPDIARLQRKIGWICHSLRIAAVGYVAWVLYILLTFWTDASAVAAGYGRMIKSDLSAVAQWQQGAALAVDLVVWLAAAIACYCAWRLCATYLEGRIFTVDAATWMRRIAVWGMVSQILSIVTRPLVAAILTSHLGDGLRTTHVFLHPNDLLVMVLLAAVLAFAHIQKTGAEIAVEHAQIV